MSTAIPSVFQYDKIEELHKNNIKGVGEHRSLSILNPSSNTVYSLIGLYSTRQHNLGKSWKKKLCLLFKHFWKELDIVYVWFRFLPLRLLYLCNSVFPNCTPKINAERHWKQSNLLNFITLLLRWLFPLSMCTFFLFVHTIILVCVHGSTLKLHIRMYRVKILIYHSFFSYLNLLLSFIFNRYYAYHDRRKTTKRLRTPCAIAMQMHSSMLWRLRSFIAVMRKPVLFSHGLYRVHGEKSSIPTSLPYTVRCCSR